MITTCPKCLAQLDFDENSPNVECSCGHKFKAGDVLEELPPLDGPSFEEEFQPEPETPSAEFPQIDPESEVSEGAVSVEREPYSESTSSFAEIRDYGEKLAQDGLEGKRRDASPAADPPQGARMGTMVTGGSLQGYRIEGYLAPVSVVCQMDPRAENPLNASLKALWDRAKKTGGNAVLGIRWTPSPDFTKILIGGTPVRCSKIEPNNA